MTHTISPYMEFKRDEWAKLRNSVPMVLSNDELERLQGINEELSMEEVSEIYLPLSRLLDYNISNNFTRQSILSHFLGKPYKTPYIIGIAGSVAVGKSTTARVLQALLSRWPEYRKVTLITTDGFLYPNHVLEERGIMNKKGFPESYDVKKLMAFISDIKAGQSSVKAPLYSHLIYDIIPNEYVTVEEPDVLIIEGLNVLQNAFDIQNTQNSRYYLSDFIDFSIYVDAEIEQLNKWYIKRFLKFRSGAFSDPDSYFHHYAQIEEGEAIKIANSIWKEVNELNLIENILPTKTRASLILKKGLNHKVEVVKLRK